VPRKLRVELVGLAVAAAAIALCPGAALAKTVDLTVLSSKPNQVSGGDALIRVDASPDLLNRLAVRRNGTDVTDSFSPQDGGLVGLVDGLALGKNELAVVDSSTGNRLAQRKLFDYPTEGPVFSGPHQYPFVCKTIQAGLGEPIVDNQDGLGFRVLNPDGSTAGWSLNCSAHTVVDYLYRSTGGQFKPLPSDGSRPTDLATTQLPDGRVVDYVVRRERGTIDRFIYSFAMLAPLGEDPSHIDMSEWNRKLIYTFDGGVAIGHNQGTPGSSALLDLGLRQGYAIIHSSGTRTSTHYNLELGGETALMTKEEFIERYGVPRYTVGLGGSGGAIQQYIYGQNYPGLIDAGIPQRSYPDMVTQTIHIGDCELLEYYMDVTDGANPKWQNWDNREWLIGLNGSSTFPNPYTGGGPGSDECVNGWRGLTPLALNPLYGSAGAGTDRMDPAVMAAVKWTHFDDLRNIYGVGPNGYARQTGDNVGVQYGLQALREGKITPAEFLDLNARVGSWKDPQDFVQEGQPFLPTGGWDPWSSRNMRLSPDGGVTPAPRREGDISAMNAAYTHGLYFDGDIDIPLIDQRDYLEEELNMHNSHQSFVSRQRMLDHDGDASNQSIWFIGPNPQRDIAAEALQVIDQWLANIRQHPELSVGENKPADATDRCFTSQGTEIARGDHAWDGILDNRPAGPCTQAFPLHSTSRIVAGGPFRGGVYKCQLQSVDQAIARGLYGSWTPSPSELARLGQIFPTGVCDYTLPDAGRP
jgi:Tannase-like family of unknown function (DUF6351)